MRKVELFYMFLFFSIEEWGFLCSFQEADVISLKCVDVLNLQTEKLSAWLMLQKHMRVTLTDKANIENELLFGVARLGRICFYM